MSTTSYEQNEGVIRWMKYYTYSDNTIFGPFSSYFYTTHTSQRTVGENYPDWKYRIANAINATTTLQGTKYYIYQRPCRASFTQGWRQSYVPFYLKSGYMEAWPYMGFTQSVPTHRVSSVNAEADALGNFIQSCKKKQTSFEGGVFLGELGETLRLLVSPARTLRKGVASYLGALKQRHRQVKRQSPSKRLATARNILADTWLEYSFGWKPLISDIHDAAKLLADQNARITQPRTQPVFGKGSSTYTATDPKWQLMGESHLVVYGHLTEEEEYMVKYYGHVRVDQPHKAGWRQAGFSLDNLVPTVWELIPFSFLVDYFSNIGEIITAVSYNVSNIAWAARTARWTHTNSVSKFYNAIPYQDTDDYFFHPLTLGGRAVFRKSTVDRAPYNGSFVPPLRLKTPANGSTKWINMAALLFTTRSMTPYHRTTPATSSIWDKASVLF